MRVFGIGKDRRGAAAVEFAFIGPLLVVLLGGIISYGGYFWTAHVVQQAANDAARAAIAGLTDVERNALAAASVAAETGNFMSNGGRAPTMAATRNGEFYTVRVTYDTSASSFWSFGALIPMPSKRITRAATIRLGGY